MASNLAFPVLFPNQSGHLILPGPAGALELSVNLPEPGEARPGIVILCHPHPQHGGTMHNKVITMLDRSMHELGLTTVKFNFRGVGKSQGAFDNGVGETNDLLTVVNWVTQSHPAEALWLAGFSFGSYVVVRAAAQLSLARHLILVAPPVGRWDFILPELPMSLCLVVQGENDEIVDPQQVYDWVSAQKQAISLIKIPDTDHFFHRRLMDLRGVLKNALKPCLPP